MQNSLPKISIRKGREWQVAHGHPWLFSGAISQAPKASPGSLVDIVDTDGRFVARGYYNAACDIAVRVLTRSPDEQIDTEFFARRLRDAQSVRAIAIDLDSTNVFRLVNAESDYLPGYIIDSYAGYLVLQSHTAGADALLPQLIAALQSVLQPPGILVRNDAGVRQREGLELAAPHIVSGQLPDELIVMENRHRFAVDLIKGQKTGFFTDQRDKRAALERYCKRVADNTRLANCFSYTGAFSVYACAGNGSLSTVNVDQSKRALDEAQHNFRLNGMDLNRHELVCEDAFDWLEKEKANGATYGITILDPPAFAKGQKDKPRALKAYRRMHALGLGITQPGGLMVTCSCSGTISFEEFIDSLKSAAMDTGKDVQILETYQNAADHPVSVVATESGYLKVVFCRVL
jgi:23S rRNA (cytosine1962-C5)-methyltransferase